VSRGFLGRAGELTGNPSSSEPTRFRLPLRFLLVGSEVDRHLSADLSTSKKAKMILEVSHAIAFLLVMGGELTCPSAISTHSDLN
jgi:hypothetical protein